MSTARKLFVNIAVHDLARAMEFWTSLGFAFNKQFTDDKAACLVFSEEAFAMLLSEPFWKTFTHRERCDTRTHTEAFLALSCTSRAEVDELVKKALAAGGKPAMPSQDHGFMYGHSFYDLDDHHWEVLWMDPSFVQKPE